MKKVDRKKLVLYGLMLAGAIIGLSIDRLGGAGPAGASAAEASARTGSQTGMTAAKPEIKGPDIARIFETADAKRAERQTTRPESAPARDAFGMTSEMHHFYEEESPAKKAEQARKVESEEERRRKEMEQFLSTHQLKGTTLGDDAAWAIINDKVVRLGERIDGFELQRVERYRAHFKKDDVAAVLSLPLPF